MLTILTNRNCFSGSSWKLVKFYVMAHNMGMDNSTARGVPITEIYGSKSPWGSPEFPLVTPSHNHSVLYHVPSDGSYLDDRPPKPQMGKDVWDHDYVRMPCSSQSLYPVVNNDGDKILKKRWAMIEKALTQPMTCSQDLAAAILSYNTKFKKIWTFRALHKLFNECLEEEESQFFFEVTLPQIARLALDLPNLIQSPIPLLKQHQNKSISLSQQQISSLLANAFFCTFPRRNTSKKASEYENYPHINFNILYDCSGDSTLEKLKCICHYFKRVCTKVPVGSVTISRRSVRPRDLPTWSGADRVVSRVPVHVDSRGTIEDAHGLIQLDFANKYLGGGVIGHGCVQEEIRFVICPELMVTMLFTEVLRPNEALMIIGSERFSKYAGYGPSFQWSGAHEDLTPRDCSGRRRTAVLAVDALPYTSVEHEYRRECITRELNKAWVGFTFHCDVTSAELQYPGVATGNWGCGAFGGSADLKCLIQLMACAVANRPMAYYTFGDSQLRDDIANMANLLTTHSVTVGQLYKYIVRFTTTDVRRNNLHEFIHRAIIDDVTSPPTGTAQCSYSKSEDNASLVPEKNDKQLQNNSPDLFCEEEESTNKSTRNYSDMSIEGDALDDDKLAGSTNKMADSVDKMAAQTSNQTSRLFQEMSKLDQGNGNLNINSSPQNSSYAYSMDCDERINTDPMSESKKKIAKKITDYFCKKNFL